MPGLLTSSRYGPEITGDVVERVGDRFRRGGDGLEVDAAVAVDEHAHCARPTRTGDLDVVDPAAERVDERRDEGADVVDHGTGHRLLLSSP